MPNPLEGKGTVTEPIPTFEVTNALFVMEQRKIAHRNISGGTPVAETSNNLLL
jgi:hypothetical protein